MEQGSLQERYLSRSVVKHIRKQDKELAVGAAVGNDYAIQGGVVTADGIGETPLIAWTKAMNNFACSGGRPRGVRLLMLLPENVKESNIKSYMADFNAYGESQNIQILGGHSQVSEAFVRQQFAVTVVGSEGSFRPRKKEIKPGYNIVMTKYAGLLGTDIILKQRYDALRERFANSYLAGAVMGEEAYSVTAEAEIAEEYVCYMHDVSHGGIYGALWQLGKWLNRGFEIDHSKINIRQETIELCEYLNVNPYLLEGTGSMLMIAEDGTDVVKKLMEHNIPATVIGHVTDNNEKLVIMNEIDIRTLSPVNGDDIYNI